MDLLNDTNRSRRVSSVLSPYNIPGNFPNNIVSPSPIRGSFLNDFKPGNFTMRKMSTNQNGENETQKEINDIISKSFKDWNNKPARKETEDIDFSGQDNPILSLLTKGGNADNQKKSPPFDVASGSIMSPDYKPRSLSINSCGWTLPPHTQLQRGNKSGWDLSKPANSPGFGNNDNKRKGDNTIISVSSFGKINLKKPAGQRKNTMLEPLNTHKIGTSPLMFPKPTAAFKPFKKRSYSVAESSSNNLVDPEPLKKRDIKAEQKLQEALQNS